MVFIMLGLTAQLFGAVQKTAKIGFKFQGSLKLVSKFADTASSSWNSDLLTFSSIDTGI